ncbi:uncharacterized protein si:dkey-100n23.5 isoform X3 [Micropterus salmoides]|uniref:uncharacterized protein si:dkey-100n23.5 isoform X3 n=1 Tax=Micropterus salmoides TaxID=27706 RepID=UPI0018EB6358|nr:uncharacterized protein si:dkey-100n23.5 isoform X3 [Micropterus salmoides]
MDGPNPKLMSNDSRCVFFNTHSEDYRCAVILTVKRATGTFSLVGCIFMLLVIWLLRRYHSLAQKMILSLTVAAFFDSVAYVMGDSHPEGALCDFQAWWLTYFDWSALAWVCLITLNLYLNLVREVVPSDGMGGASGHGLFATAKGLLWPRRSLVLDHRRSRSLEIWDMVRASVQPHLPDDLLLRQDHLRGQREDAVMVGNLQPREREAKGFFGRGDQAVEVVSLRLPAGVYLPPHQQLALQSRLCDRTRIGEYHPGAVRYTQADLVDLSDDDDDDTNVLFYSPDMTLKDRGP